MLDGLIKSLTCFGVTDFRTEPLYPRATAPDIE